MAAQMASDWLLMIFTSVRLAPIISILSMTMVWMSTITMPYSTCGIGLNTACISRTMMSKASMVADTGSLNHLLSTSGGMSRPPVDAPERMTMPSETPMPRPAKTVQRKMSSVSTRPFAIPSNRARKAGLRTLLASVLRAKARPRTTQPQTSMAMLMKNSSPETDRPVNRPMASAMPVAPPVMRPAGSRNRATASE